MQNIRLPHLFFPTLAVATATLAPAQSLEAYGTGTPGTGGRTPALWATSTPRPGNSSYGLVIENGRPGATAVGFISAGRANVNLGGVRVLIDLGVSWQLPFLTLNRFGKGAYPLPLPNQASLVGARVTQQAFVADTGGAPLGFAATQGLETTVTNFGMLVGTRSTGRTNQPQIAINLETGVQSTFSQTDQTNVGNPSLSPGVRRYLLTGSGLSNKVAAFDCDQFPPAFVADFSTPLTPWAVQFHPDGVRAYVIEQGPSGSTPIGRVVWGNPSLPLFGQAYPGNAMALGVQDALQIRFTKDGNTGILGTLGLFGGGADIRRYNTNPSSRNYNAQTGNLLYPGKFLFGLTMIDDNRVAVAMASLGGQVSVTVIEINTMVALNTFSSTPFGQVIRGMVTGPRGRYVYCGNAPSTRWSAVPGVLRINVDANDPNYGQIANINAGMGTNWSVYDVAVSDSGDRIYAIAGEGIQTSFKGEIIEYDAETLAKLRSWNMDGLGNLYNLLLR